MKKSVIFILTLLIWGSIIVKASSNDELPKAVEKTVLKYGALEQITSSIKGNDEDEGEVYFITLESDEKVVYLTIALDGRLVSLEEEPVDEDYEDSSEDEDL